MTLRASTAALSLVALLGFSAVLPAQKTKPPTVAEILNRLEANLDHYDAAVPSLFCEEHAVSRVTPAQRDQDTVTDSIFRLKRTANPDHTTSLIESREIGTVNGKPAASQNLDGPAMLSGWFEGGQAIVSSKQAACINYSLQRVDTKHPGAPYVIRFATVLTPQNSSGCLLEENSKGRAFIDPASMQITRLEITTPHHTIVPGDAFRPPVVGERVLTVEYTPVLLGGEEFWMPSAITMRAMSGAGTFHPMIWSFGASYRNYHKLEVTSRVLPGEETPAP